MINSSVGIGLKVIVPLPFSQVAMAVIWVGSKIETAAASNRLQ